MNTEHREREVAADVTDEAPGEAAVRPRPRVRRIVATAVTVVMLAAAGAAWAPFGRDAPTGTPEMAMVTPDGVLDLATVSPAVASEYHYAADHAAAYRQMRCWCGCEKAFEHRTLTDCFVRPDGAWEAHGAGCGVCLAEAMTAHRRLDAGDSPADIARGLDEQFGPPPLAPTGA